MKPELLPGVQYALRALSRVWYDLPREPAAADTRRETAIRRDTLVHAMQAVSGNPTFLPLECETLRSARERAQPERLDDATCAAAAAAGSRGR